LKHLEQHWSKSDFLFHSNVWLNLSYNKVAKLYTEQKLYQYEISWLKI